MSPVQRPDGQPRGGRDDGARFGGAIAGRPGRPPLFLLVFVAATTGLVALGLAGRESGTTPATQPPATAALAAATESPPPPPVVAPAPSPEQAPIVTSAAGSELAFTIRRHPETMFVHGDVFPIGVTWVFVNIVSIDGRVAAWTQVSLPGGTSTPPQGRPSMRFDVELALPPWASGPLWVQGTAYNADGSVIEQQRLGVWPDGAPMTATDGGAFMATTVDPVDVEVPAFGAAPVTETTLTVSGSLQVDADSIVVALMTSDRRLLASRTVRTADLHGGIRPDRLPMLEVRLGIPAPRPTDEPVWLVITAYDADGAAIGFQRRQVVIGELGAPGA